MVRVRIKVRVRVTVRILDFLGFDFYGLGFVIQYQLFSLQCLGICFLGLGFRVHGRVTGSVNVTVRVRIMVVSLGYGFKD